MSTRSSIVNVKSRLLTEEQNQAIFHGLGNRCRTSATTVGELHRAADDKRQTWEKQYSGVVCCVKDFVKRSYFIRFYEGKEYKMMWEHDIRKYINFKFTTSDGCVTLTVHDHKLVFTDKDEAENLQKEAEVVVGKLKERRARRPDVRSKITAPSGGNTAANIPTRKSSDKKMKKLSREDIGIPTNFKHVNRVTWDPDTGLDMKKLDPDFRALFENIGITDESYIDEETLDFIYDFIDQQGGAKAVKDDLEKRELRKKNQIRPPPPPLKGTAPPPPPPSRGQTVPPPPPSARRIGPPPPPSSNRYQPPPSPPDRKQFVPPPPPPSNRNQPPPPPPAKKWFGPPPPPPPARQTGVPPPPAPAKAQGPPPPPSASGNQPKPPPGKQNDDKLSAETSPKDFAGGAAGGDNPLKQQIMQLLLHNPAEITDFIYDIVDKRGGLDFIKGNLAERNSRTNPSKQNDQDSETSSTDKKDEGKDSSDDQVPGKSSSDDQVPGRSFAVDEVPGRRSSDNVSGATAQRLSDLELSRDIFDDDDDEEWNDLTDQIDQY